MKNQHHPDPSEKRILAPFARGASLLGVLALLAAAPSASAQLTSTTTTANGHAIVKFTGGTGTWTPPDGVTSVEVLVVGGGGGGGGNSGGGGGAGGVIHQTGFSVSGGVTVTVGGGGIGGISGGAAPGSGTSSVFSSLAAYGGGNGASYGSPNTAAGSGGSGGGGSWAGNAGGSATPSGQGNNGGTGCTGGGYAGGGGGGAGAVGTSGGAIDGRFGGAGGSGASYSISGSAQYYGGGGGGGADNGGSGAHTGGAGGQGGGGNGATAGASPTLPVAGTANTGGGGGGGCNTSSSAYQSGAAGGSGVVIVAYAVATPPPTKLVFTSVPANPIAGQPFSVTVESQDIDSSPEYVTSDTTVQLSVSSGSGTLSSGTTSGTIFKDTSSVTISGVIYTGLGAMSLTATTTSGMSLTAATTNLSLGAGNLASTTVSSGGNTIVTFTSGNGAWFVPAGVTNVQVLMVGGGGGGGVNSGGGGGAGGVIYSSTFGVSSVVAVTVGGGGAGATSSAVPGSGTNSVFSTLTAIGGGRGGSYAAGGVASGSGGSGGGGNWSSSAGASGTAGQGNSGGTGNNSGGGGGGAGASGSSNSGANGGNGGIGVQYSISGAAAYYGGGGGGGGNNLNGNSGTAGSGGAGGGGNGSMANAGSAGTANTGGGGGGSSNAGTQQGGAGGSGVVIVSYANAPTKLGFSSVPASPTAGQPFSVTVQVQDDSGSPKTATSGTEVQLSVTSGSGTLSGTKIGTIGNGTNSFTFTDLVYSEAGTMTLQAAVSSGMSLSSGTANLTFNSQPTVATPTFSLPAGGYLGAQTVTISCGTAGSTVYYTTDDTIPTTDSPRGEVGSGSATVEIPVPTSLTLKAIATYGGYLNSAEASAAYVTLTGPTWTNLAGGKWPVTSNWQGGVIGQGIGLIADFSTLTLSDNTVVTLDSSPTIGGLLFGDVGNAKTWTVIPGSPAGTLTLDNGASTPTITVGNQTTTLAAPLAGAAGFVKAGTGKLVLGAANTFSGGSVTVNEGTLQLNGPVVSGQGQLKGVTTITVNAGGTLLTKVGDALGWTPGMEALVIHGGTVTNDSGGALTLGNPLNMTGGTLSATGNGWITIDPDTHVIAATSDANGTPATIVGVQIQQGANIEFSVTRGLLTPASDLNVNSILNRGTSGNLSVSGNGIMTLSGNNTYQGNTIVNNGATLKLASAGLLTFKPTSNGNSNKLTGTGTVILDGGLVIDLTAADTTTGNSWTLVDVGTLAVTFDTNFQVVDFTEQIPGSGIWTKTTTTTGGDLTWTFTKSTGQLTVATGGTNNYAGWASTHGIPGEPATGDFDHDGISNLMEYALGLEPTVPTGSSGTLTGKLLSFNKGAAAVANGDVTWAIEESDDLGLSHPWTEVATYTENTSTTISCTLPEGKDKAFARLVVHQIP